MAKITEYPVTTEIANDDVLLVDGTGGTRGLSVSGFSEAVANNIVGSTAITGLVADIKADIQEKGDEVIDSIPSDYTALQGEVSDLKSDLSKYDDGTKTLPANWVRGIIVLDSSESLGIKFDATVEYRVSTFDPITLDAGTVITIGEGFRAILFRKVTSTGKYTSTTPWLTASYTVPSDVECFVVVGRLTDITSEVADVYEFSSALQILTNTQREINNINGMLPRTDVVRVIKESNNIQIVTNFKGSNLVVAGKITQTDVTNDTFDLYNYSGSFSKIADDDICPIYYNGSYRCAGHGNLVAFNLTAPGHGKTVYRPRQRPPPYRRYR